MQRLVAPETEWSASRFESYRTCPFQFFAHYGLNLSELVEEQDEADAATRGRVVHEMLEDALAPLVEQRSPLDAAGVALAGERLRTRGLDIWNEAPAKHAFGRVALWRYEGESIVDDLVAWLEREAAAGEALGVTRVVGGEQEFLQALPGVAPPLLVQARIDRVDQSGGALQVVDYKTGRPIPRSDVESGRRLQLQLYSIVAGAQLNASRLIARYSFLRPGNDVSLDSGHAEDRAVLDDATRVAAEVRESVRTGHFEVHPEPPDCPSYCDFRTMCRVNNFSRSKSWH